MRCHRLRRLRQKTVHPTSAVFAIAQREVSASAWFDQAAPLFGFLRFSWYGAPSCASSICLRMSGSRARAKYVTVATIVLHRFTALPRSALPRAGAKRRSSQFCHRLWILARVGGKVADNPKDAPPPGTLGGPIPRLRLFWSLLQALQWKHAPDRLCFIPGESVHNVKGTKMTDGDWPSHRFVHFPIHEKRASVRCWGN